MYVADQGNSQVARNRPTCASETLPLAIIGGSTQVNATAADALASMTLEQDVRRAWKEQKFTLAYQPQFDLSTNGIVAFEALLRWSDQSRGAVSPAEFIPIVEKAGLMHEIGQWVLRTACRAAAYWPDHIAVAVNLSPIQLENKALAGIVAAALSESGLPAARLELELTESWVLQDDYLATLQDIRNSGVRIAIDDFDTGFSALSHLLRISVDKIKVDRSFVARLGKDEERHAHAYAILKSLAGLCRDLDMTLLAEGVETREQLLILRETQCAQVQGFLCGRPQSAFEIESLLEKPGQAIHNARGWAASRTASPSDAWSKNVPFSHIADKLNDIVIVTSPDLVQPGPLIIYVNPAFTRLTGYTAHEVIGKSPRILQGPGTNKAVLATIAIKLREGRSVHERVLNYAKSGAPYWLDLQITPLLNPAGEITHFVAVERDVTLDKRRLDELEHLADRDTLTGIPNLRAFLRAVKSEIELAVQKDYGASAGKGTCLVFLDVDHFKKVNDGLGHSSGDAVLCGIADCLAENVRRIDILGRIGGEEFGICMPSVTLAEAEALADRLRIAVAGTAMATQSGPVRVTVSIGVACFVPGESIDEAIARADTAMYAAKRAGRNQIRVHRLEPVSDRLGNPVSVERKKPHVNQNPVF